MNDRFKFRVWDKINSKWVERCLLDIESGYILGYYDNQQAYKRRYVIMQSTGLKDKNGKLIYEGDIVKEYCYNTKKTAIKKIIFDESICGYAYTDGIEYNSLCFSDCRRLEVIGNIYHDSHFLKNRNN